MNGAYYRKVIDALVEEARDPMTDLQGLINDLQAIVCIATNTLRKIDEARLETVLMEDSNGSI